VIKIPLQFIHPADPFGLKVGGTETFMKGFIKYAPNHFDIEVIGITSNRKERIPRKWTRLKLGDKEFNFFPIFYERNENEKTLIPLSLRFTMALKLVNLKSEGKVLFFNRIEPLFLYRRQRAPKIVVTHTDIQQQIRHRGSENTWSKFPHLYFKLEKKLFSFVDQIHTVNKSTLDFYIKTYPEHKERISYLPNWVDSDTFYPTDLPKHKLRQKLYHTKNLPIGSKWILFVGRLQKAKSPFRLVNAFLKYNKKYRSSILIIIGEGNLRKSLENYVKKIKAERVIFFLKNMRQEALADFYRASDVLLLTSNFEGMPMCVLEALGCGIPVVSTDVGDIKSVVGNNFSGEIIDSFDHTEIAQGLEKVLSNAHAYKKENCIECIRGFSPKEILLSVYKKIEQIYISKKYRDI